MKKETICEMCQMASLATEHDKNLKDVILSILNWILSQEDKTLCDKILIWMLLFLKLMSIDRDKISIR